MNLTRIAHVSDPHFGTVFPGVEEALVSRLRSLSLQALVLTGDITQRARRDQFAAARSFLGKLGPVPAVLVPGNHDIPLFNLPIRLFNPYFGYRSILGGKLDRRVDLGPMEVVALNSTSRWRHVQGRLSSRRIKETAGPPTGRVRIAAFHHPLDCAAPADEKNLLRNARAALSALAESGVDLVLGGHIHDPHVSLSDTRYPGVCRPLILATAGTCASWRTRLNSPNSFHLIEVTSGPDTSLKISRYELSKEETFRPAAELAFRRAPDGGWNYLESSTPEEGKLS